MSLVSPIPPGPLGSLVRSRPTRDGLYSSRQHSACREAAEHMESPNCYRYIDATTPLSHAEYIEASEVVTSSLDPTNSFGAYLLVVAGLSHTGAPAGALGVSPAL
jgi:hypothetical protein